MASLPRINTITHEEWLHIPEVTDFVEEVVNGEIRIAPPENWKHAYILDYLHASLKNQLKGQPVRALASSLGLIIRKSPLISRVPDIPVFRDEGEIELGGYLHSAPQLLVEVLSPANTRRERQTKLDDYSAIGVPEVWIVSPEARTVEILRLQDGRLRTTAILAEGLLKPRLFPGVQVDIVAIWPD
jgi:Uma2 family endonuclease